MKVTEQKTMNNINCQCSNSSFGKCMDANLSYKSIDFFKNCLKANNHFFSMLVL